MMKSPHHLPIALVICAAMFCAACSGSAPAAAPTATTAAPASAAQATPAATPQVYTAGAAPQNAAASCNGQLRKLTIGVPVTPPNVVHTSPFVARGLGLFARRCIDADIVQFDGGLSQ